MTHVSVIILKMLLCEFPALGNLYHIKICSVIQLLKTNKGKKRGQKSGHTKKKNSKIKNPNLRRSTKALGNGSDISAKLFATMEKHKEVCSSDPFYECHLVSSSIAFGNARFAALSLLASWPYNC